MSNETVNPRQAALNNLHWELGTLSNRSRDYSQRTRAVNEARLYLQQVRELTPRYAIPTQIGLLIISWKISYAELRMKLPL